MSERTIEVFLGFRWVPIRFDQIRQMMIIRWVDDDGPVEVDGRIEHFVVGTRGNAVETCDPRDRAQVLKIFAKRTDSDARFYLSQGIEESRKDIRREGETDEEYVVRVHGSRPKECL